jgi:GT2 family glycosyltransferase/SAM-dependent methyltransferase
MNARVIEWLSGVAAELEFEGPVVEFGSLQIPGQNDCADARRFFGDLTYVGCDQVEGPGVDLVCDVERSPFSPERFGTVVCLETLEHVKHPWLAAGEAYRILKPGGLLLVSVPFMFPVHSFPDDYWRMTAKGLEVLLSTAGFEEIRSSDSGEEVEWDLSWDVPEENIATVSYPHISFAVARKPLGRTDRSGDGFERAPAATWPDNLVERAKLSREGDRKRQRVEIIVPVFHREEETRLMFDQLSKVTDDYDLIIVNNGFDDPEYLKGLGPTQYIENVENTGAIRPINAGLDVSQSEFVCVLHNDLLIYDEGWLDHIIEFMERRPDVGLVGFAGRHAIKVDGSLDLETTVVDMRSGPLSLKPRWRITEVAAIDGLGYVMRNVGLRLEEGLGLMHFYDLDISLQYIDAGYRVYVAAVEIAHLAEDASRTTRSMADYLDRIGGDDEAYYEEVREKFRTKWQHMLPITRGFQDEDSANLRISEQREELETLEKGYHALEDLQLSTETAYKDLEVYTRRVEESYKHAVSQIAAGTHKTEGRRAPSRLARFKSSMKDEGLVPTLKRTGRFVRRKSQR